MLVPITPFGIVMCGEFYSGIRNTRKMGTAAEAVSVGSTWTEATFQLEPLRAITEFCFGIGVSLFGSNSTSSVSAFHRNDKQNIVRNSRLADKYGELDW